MNGFFRKVCSIDKSWSFATSLAVYDKTVGYCGFSDFEGTTWWRLYLLTHLLYLFTHLLHLDRALIVLAYALIVPRKEVEYLGVKKL